MVHYVELPHTQLQNELYKAFVKSELKNFRKLLISNIPYIRLRSVEKSLTKTAVISFDPGFKLEDVLLYYVKSLRYVYYEKTNVCGYIIQPDMGCPYTKAPLDKVIRLVEHGNEVVQPLHWIGPTFSQFLLEAGSRWSAYSQLGGIKR